MNTTPLPMLAHNADPANLDRMLTSPAWAVQPKLDGHRVIIDVVGGVATAYGRNGQRKVTNVTPALLAPFRGLASGRFVLDGEIVDGTLWLFDLPVAEGFLTATATFTERYDILGLLVELLGAPNVRLVPLATTTAAKRAMLASAEADRKEGVMFRLTAAPYDAGRRSSALLKHKFVMTIDCLVTAVGSDGKAAAELAVHDHAGAPVVIGRASTIGKNKAGGGIRVGQVVEVRFLYVNDPAAPRLYQPRILAVRTDKAAAECSVDQLIGAHTDRSVLAA